MNSRVQRRIFMLSASCGALFLLARVAGIMPALVLSLAFGGLIIYLRF